MAQINKDSWDDMKDLVDRYNAALSMIAYNPEVCS